MGLDGRGVERAEGDDVAAPVGGPRQHPAHRPSWSCSARRSTPRSIWRRTWPIRVGVPSVRTTVHGVGGAVEQAVEVVAVLAGELAGARLALLEELLRLCRELADVTLDLVLLELGLDGLADRRLGHATSRGCLAPV